MDTQTFLKAVKLYESKGGKATCSPNQSCEGGTPDVVILKDFEGLPIAKVSLSTGEVDTTIGEVDRRLAILEESKRVEVDRPGATSASSGAGVFCQVVARVTLVGGLSGGLVGLGTANPVALLSGLGAAASSAPIFALGSIANSTKRSASIAQQIQMQMAEQEDRRRAAKPTPEPASDGEAM